MEEKEPSLTEISDYDKDLSPKKKNQILLWMAVGVLISLILVMVAQQF